MTEKNRLYYGDNLQILRDEIKDETIDLIYLDPPFNSNATYNILFRSPTGEQSKAQLQAFEDTWHWTNEAEDAFDEVIKSGNSDAAEILRAMRLFLKENDMMAYLAMMSVRLLELHRVLKPTGSLYLHCDPTASHYLKLLLDAVFGADRFLNEITWKRANAHNDPRRFGRISDKILYYSKTLVRTWTPQHTAYREEYYESHFKLDDNRRYYRTVPLDAPRHGEGSPGLLYSWKGKLPAPTRTWAVKRETMEQYEREGRLRYTRTGTPTLLQYADEMPGVPLQDLWSDIPPVNPQAIERLGYPTQEPVALLERIVTASSDPGDVVLDPFCGCGTTVHAAQKLERRWIGIDITPLAINLIEQRLNDAFQHVSFEVLGTPTDLDGAMALAARDKYHFQYWVVWLLKAVNYRGKKKGADSGIDGLIYFRPDPKTLETAILSVKGGENITVSMIRDLAGVLPRVKGKIGVLVTLNPPTKPMIREAAAAGFFEFHEYNSGVQLHQVNKVPRIQILTVEQLLGGARPQIPNVTRESIKRAEMEHIGRQQGFGFASGSKPTKLPLTLGPEDEDSELSE